MKKIDEYLKFRNFEVVTGQELELANNYICAQLQGTGPNYKYYCDMYSYATKCFSVLEWKDKNGFNQKIRLGEALCNDKIVIFFLIKNIKNADVDPSIIMQFFN